MPKVISPDAAGFRLEEIEDVRAFFAEGGEGRSAAAVEIVNHVREGMHDFVTRNFHEDEVTVFEKAGWVLGGNTNDTESAARDLNPSNAETALRRVYRNPEGYMFVETDRIVVRFEEKIGPEFAAEFGQRENLTLVRQIEFAPNLYEYKIRDNEPLLDRAADLRTNVEVEYADPQLAQRLTGQAKPNDPRYPRQWQWNNDGSNGGLAGADVHAEDAWDIARGGEIRVAVVDNGMDITHPDLESGIVGGGYFASDPYGSGTFIPYVAKDPAFPDANHGTFCMGMAGARWENGEGGVGSAPACGLIPVACLPDQVGPQSTLARAIAYAANPNLEDKTADPGSGAHIIACSLGPNGATWIMQSVLRDAIDYAVTNGRGGLGCPVFWAVTNGNFEIKYDQVCSYQNTIAVGRSSRMDLDDGSGYGPELDFLAPGVDVYSTNSGGNYGISTGTSFAAPCAAGIGALVIECNPQFTWDQVRDKMREACDKIGPYPYTGGTFGGRNDTYGYGRVNAHKSVL